MKSLLLSALFLLLVLYRWFLLFDMELYGGVFGRKIRKKLAKD
jgi:hypothetical protein